MFSRERKWKAGIPEEVGFWQMALADPGNAWDAEDYSFRVNPESPASSELCELIPAKAGDLVRILDVGAGPLTNLGKRWEGRTVQITAVDALAAEYDSILRQYKITPPVRTVFGIAENPTGQFSRDFFDLVHACNSLDHMCDPVRVIRQMVSLVKPGRCVYMMHFENEGSRRSFCGLHQWDFQEHHGDLILSSNRRWFRNRSITSLLRGRAQVSCSRRPIAGGLVVSVIRKLPA